MQKTVLVQKNSNGRIKFIELTLVDNTVSRVWGLVGSTKQQTTANSYDYINAGKSNELSPVEAAKEDYSRIITTKTKEGYLIADSLENLPNFNNDQMDFDELPVQFCLSKPTTKVTEKKVESLIRAKEASFFLKYNGLAHYILITSVGEIKMYTRRIDECSIKYPNIVEAIRRMNLPAKTLLAVEFVIDPNLGLPHMEGFNLMSSISKSDTLKGSVKGDITKTLNLQKINCVKAVVFNVLYYDGERTIDLPYSKIMSDYMPKFSPEISGEELLMVPELFNFKRYKDALKWVIMHSLQYEGLVLWNAHENAKITYNGTPNRTACYKLKAVLEDDVVAYDWKEGTGAKQGKVGSLYIGKYNAEGEMVPMGRVGSGLKIKQGECEIDYWKLPCVIEISYDQRFPTGAYQFPRFTGKVHLEKIPSDVVVDEKGF